MEFKFTDEHNALRDEVRTFLKDALPMTAAPGLFGPPARKTGPSRWSSSQKLAAKGWIAPAWPKEYGGAGLEPHGAVHLQRGDRATPARPNGGGVISVGMIGPTLIVHGTDEQKQEHLPASSAARSSGARATASRAPAPTSPPSRPAPSATATTTSSTARRSGRPARTTPTGCSCLARTDPDAPKHRGISYFLLVT